MQLSGEASAKLEVPGRECEGMGEIAPEARLLQGTGMYPGELGVWREVRLA